MVCISLDKNTNEGLAWTEVALSVPGACFVFLFFSFPPFCVLLERTNRPSPNPEHPFTHSCHWNPQTLKMKSTHTPTIIQLPQFWLFFFLFFCLKGLCFCFLHSKIPLSAPISGSIASSPGAWLDSAAPHHFPVRRELCTSEICLSVDLSLNLMSQLGFDAPSPQGAAGQGIYKPLLRVSPNKHIKVASSICSSSLLTESTTVKRLIIEIPSPYLKIEEDIFTNPLLSEES